MARRNRPDLQTGQRVRCDNFRGPVGTVLVYAVSQLGTAWKVKLDHPDAKGRLWRWPKDVVADSDGAYEHDCHACGILFRSDDPRGVLCPYCDPTPMVASHSAPGDQIRDTTTYLRERRRRREGK